MAFSLDSAKSVKHWISSVGRQGGGVAHLGKLALATLKYQLGAQAPIGESQSISRALDWLCRAQDAAGGHGLSAGYSLIAGWLPAYPETTGYAIPTFLANADGHPTLQLRERALRSGDWLSEIQFPSGAICSKYYRPDNHVPSVFNTGMVLHGWVSLAEREPRFAEPARKAVAWLIEQQDSDGAWRRNAFNKQPHAYYTMVAWALMRWHRATGESAARDAALRNLDWTLAQQQPNGWIDQVTFTPSEPATTHVLSYATQGLVESARLHPRQEWVQAALRASLPLRRSFESRGSLSATFSREWLPTDESQCGVGNAQTVLVWSALGELLNDKGWRDAAAQLARCTQQFQREARSLSSFDGAVPGSWPIWGFYDPFSFPNHAAKFYVDALRAIEMQRPSSAPAHG